MDVAFAIASLILGFFILIIGGEAVVRSAVSIAARLRVSPSVIALTVIAAGTSGPELVTSLFAALRDVPDIALGNVIGSNTFNLLAIVGLSAIIRSNKVERGLAQIELPLLLLFTVALIAMEWDLTLSRIDGIMCLAMLAGFTLLAVYRATRGRKTVDADDEIKILKGWRWDTGYMITGIASLLGGAYLALEGGVALGEFFGMSERVIGITIISIGTGLPELATSTVAAYRGRNDIAISNVIGSNIVNTLGIAGVAATVTPIGVSDEIVYVDSFWMLGATAVFFPILWLGRLRIDRPIGVIMLVAYAGYLGYLLRQ